MVPDIRQLEKIFERNQEIASEGYVPIMNKIIGELYKLTVIVAGYGNHKKVKEKVKEIFLFKKGLDLILDKDKIDDGQIRTLGASLCNFTAYFAQDDIVRYFLDPLNKIKLAFLDSDARKEIVSNTNSQEGYSIQLRSDLEELTNNLEFVNSEESSANLFYKQNRSVLRP